MAWTATVYGMMFRELGSAHVPAGTGYGGLNTWNSSDNLIRNNHFVENENASAEAGLIHGVLGEIADSAKDDLNRGIDALSRVPPTGTAEIKGYPLVVESPRHDVDGGSAAIGLLLAGMAAFEGVRWSVRHWRD